MDMGRTSLRQATLWAHTIHEVAAPQYYMGVDPGVRSVVRISRGSSYLRTNQRPMTKDHKPRPTIAYIEIYP